MWLVQVLLQLWLYLHVLDLLRWGLTSPEFEVVLLAKVVLHLLHPFHLKRIVLGPQGEREGVNKNIVQHTPNQCFVFSTFYEPLQCKCNQTPPLVETHSKSRTWRSISLKILQMSNILRFCISSLATTAITTGLFHILIWKEYSRAGRQGSRQYQ